MATATTGSRASKTLRAGGARETSAVLFAAPRVPNPPSLRIRMHQPLDSLRLRAEDIREEPPVSRHRDPESRWIDDFRTRDHRETKTARNRRPPFGHEIALRS